jgi:hypothetical protein
MVANINDYVMFTDKKGRVGFKQYDTEFNMWVEVFFPMQESNETIKNEEELHKTIKNMCISDYKNI